jgi:hypothetical protein
MVEAWSTCSDTKNTTYIRTGDPITISRSEADAQYHSAEHIVPGTKGKGKQATLPFLSKMKPATKHKKFSKENNIVRFVNKRGSGGVIFSWSRYELFEPL